MLMVFIIVLYQQKVIMNFRPISFKKSPADNLKLYSALFIPAESQCRDPTRDLKFLRDCLPLRDSTAKRGGSEIWS